MSPLLPLVATALLAGPANPPPPPDVDKVRASGTRRTAVRQLLVRRLAEQERFDELVALYREDTQEHPGESEGWRRLGTALLFLRADLPGALPALQEAVRLRAEEADSHLLLGVCLNGLARHPEAVAAFEEALRLDPEVMALRPAAKASFEAAQRGEGWP